MSFDDVITVPRVFQKIIAVMCMIHGRLNEIIEVRQRYYHVKTTGKDEKLGKKEVSFEVIESISEVIGKKLNKGSLSSGFRYFLSVLYGFLLV